MHSKGPRDDAGQLTLIKGKLAELFSNLRTRIALSWKVIWAPQIPAESQIGKARVIVIEGSLSLHSLPGAPPPTSLRLETPILQHTASPLRFVNYRTEAANKVEATNDEGAQRTASPDEKDPVCNPGTVDSSPFTISSEDIVRPEISLDTLGVFIMSVLTALVTALACLHSGQT